MFMQPSLIFFISSFSLQPKIAKEILTEALGPSMPSLLELLQVYAVEYGLYYIKEKQCNTRAF